MLFTVNASLHLRKGELFQHKMPVPGDFQDWNTALSPKNENSV